jgi:hypothetical protein
MDENYYPGYRIAVKEMKETLKGTASDLSLPRPMNPPLNIASSATTGGSVSNVTYAVIISIDNSDGRLGSGSSATVTFQGEQEEKTE